MMDGLEVLLESFSQEAYEQGYKRGEYDMRRKLEQMQRLCNDVLAERDAAIQRAEAAEREAYDLELQRDILRGALRSLDEWIKSAAVAAPVAIAWAHGWQLSAEDQQRRDDVMRTVKAALDGSGSHKEE